MDERLSYKIIITIPQVISLSACFWFFRCFFLLRRRTLGLKMILILCISDFLFHIVCLNNTWMGVNESDVGEVWSIILESLLRFSLFWASSIAFLALKSLQKDINLDPISYAKTSFIIVLTLTVILSVMFGVLEQTLTLLFVTLIIPLFLSLLLTTTCYLKSIYILKNSTDYSPESVQKTMKNLYIYSFVQIITTGPIVIYSFVAACTENESDLIMTIVLIPVGFLGFANSLAYFFQRATSHGMSNIDKFEKTGSLSSHQGRSLGEISFTQSTHIL